ncbi:S1C family serine protease [Reyranella sp. CPCC 100927]|uniref:S1C family serine protease n=1 Tax=Reyranella sp. CPCC 100927 TaxID=2599616 RepID=UPI0011B62799|nr:S1C family serine protease [Reyranella sp. CPCC 100927]TWT13672.1 serine protease [Reyranella sp. CPCC 100927]
MADALSPNPIEGFSAALAGMVATVASGIVAVRAKGSVSSGFVWQPGFVVTADDALADEGPFAVTPAGGESIQAQLVGRDPTTDIALLRVDGAAAPQSVALTDATVPPGAVVLAVGADNGAPTVALGVVSRAGGPWRSLRGGEIDARIELDLRMRRSAEGGVALGASGQAIGMTVFGPHRRVLVIPAATIERVASTLQRHGRIARGYLGLGLQPVALDGGGSGAMVISVDPQGPGARAGLHQGDIVVAWNGEVVRHLQTLLRALGPGSVGQTVTLGTRRAGEARQVSLTIAERPTT